MKPAPRTPAPRDAGTRAEKEATPGPRLPHERDQSAEAQAPHEPPEVGRQAHEDLERGLVDTDRGPVLDRTYRRRVVPKGGDRSGIEP